ncbi:E3 ubiquitin-protein ligase bre1 [Dissophora globulifera]|uniref:E3 ubiquitin protein ligase n=1 Tax=Dissophora globulifera TaxID=979702 RepID=A0A9P6RBV4_9FUNG|nr:E3 ubiquitin-protein ligase bre1 [Dissophora globulifera]
MEDRSIRKRKLTDEAARPPALVASPGTLDSNGSAAGPGTMSPLPKKNRVPLGDSSSTSPHHDHISSSKEAPNPLSTTEDVLLSYQKDAIWRQMQEYKREYSRAQDRITQLHHKQVDYEAHLSTVDIYWNTLLQDLKMIMARVDIHVDAKDLVLQDGTSFAAFLLNGPTDNNQHRDIKELTTDALVPALEARSQYTKEIVLKLLQIIEEWSGQRDTFWSSVSNADPSAKESVVVQGLTQEHDRIAALYKKGQVDIDQLQAQCHGFADQVLRLKNELEMTRNRLEETAESLDDSKEKLRWVEKNLDREKSAIVAAVTSGEIFGENYNGTPDAGTPSAGPLDLKNEVHDASRDELLQYRDLSMTRLSELEEMKTQRVQLKNELDSLKVQLNQIPDDRIQDTQHVKSLLSQIQYARNDAEHYRNEAVKLRSEMEELYLSRRKFMENLESEEKTRRASLEGELKKLESDISRLRDSRDRFQQMYEARCTKDDYEMQQNQEIRKIANTRKDRITTLATDIQRLQIMLAANTGDKDAFAFYLHGATDKSFLDDLRYKLKASEEQIKGLCTELEASKEATSQLRDLEQAIVSERQLKRQVEDLTAKLTKLERLIGDSVEDPAKGLMATIEARDKQIEMLEMKVQAHEAVQTPLLNELHTVATAWGQLEEATSRKVIDLAQKEDLIYKLLSDKTRQESKCNLLIRAKDASANMTAVMKRQSDMQLDQIRKLEEREKNLNMQMATLEREQTLLNSSVVLHKTKLQEYTQQNAGFKDKFARQEERLAELQNMLRERTEAHENEAHARRRLVEETEAMKRKLEEQAKAESTAGGGENSEAGKQAARYLKLLKCPACDMNFKSHVILRCMHVFCKQCMDNQLEFRQRKCPTCRESFGAKDVKEIYL